MGSLVMPSFQNSVRFLPNASRRFGMRQLYCGKGESHGSKKEILGAIEEERRVHQGPRQSGKRDARVQGRRAEIGREEEGHQPETGDRHRVERGAAIRREDSEEGRRREEKGRGEKGSGKEGSGKEGRRR